MSIRGSFSKRLLALTLSAATGFGVAAAVSAFMTPHLQVAHGFGQGDGLTRYVVTAASGPATPQFVAALAATPGVANAQALHSGGALVATRNLTLQQLRALPGVADVAFSPQAKVLGTTITDPYWGVYGYNLQNTGSNSYRPGTAGFDVAAPDGWSSGTGAGLTVADIDTGYYTAHEDMQGALWTNPNEACGATSDTDGDGHIGDCHGWNFTTDSGAIDNGTGGEHGTATSGVIAERLNNGVGTAGVAPDAQVMPLTIGSGENVDINLGIEAIYYAVDHGAKAINASWGGTMDAVTLSNLVTAIRYADSHGVVFVAAAGNDGGNRDTAPLYPASLGGNAPGSLPNVITVGWMDANGAADQNSGYGATTVDLFAPGDLIPTTWNGDNGQQYMLVSGTSLAAPHVTAAAALYRAAMPTATAAQIKAAIDADVSRQPSLTGKAVTGGMLSLTHLAAPGSGAVSYSFASLDQPAGTVTPSIGVAGTGGSGHYTVRIGLGMNYQHYTWAVSGVTMTMSGQSGTTDDNGEVTFDLGTLSDVGPQTLTPTVALGAGQYALAVQMYKDGAPLGRTYAAPMFVGVTPPSPPATGGSTPTTSAAPSAGSGSGSGGSGSGTPGATSSPSASAAPSGAPAPSGGSSGTGTGTGTGTGSSPAGSTPAPALPSAGSAGPTAGAGTGSGSGSGGSAPATSSAPAAPSSPAGGGSTPSSPAAPSAPALPPAGSSDPSTGSGSTGTGSNGLGGQQNYAPTGVFGLTSISPSNVSTVGGTPVTVTGTAIPANPQVLVAGTTAATVVSANGTSLTFLAPALAAGTYDVTVFDSSGTQSSTLTGALTYVDVSSSGSGSAGGSGAGGSGTGGSGTGSSGTGGSGTGSGTGGSGTGGSGTGGSSAPMVTTGPNGERLVQSTRYAALTDSFWSAACGGCGGTVL